MHTLKSNKLGLGKEMSEKLVLIFIAGFSEKCRGYDEYSLD